MLNLSFYKNKRVLVTGHTGFKGAWICGVLSSAGAMVTGYALEPRPGGAFGLCKLDKAVDSRIGDIRDFEALNSVFSETKPEIVIHMAAQPLVLDSLERPLYTFDINVIGTANLLECVRQHEEIRSLVVVTTDKVYRNSEWVYGYRENDELGGDDPYSASKACAELVTQSYRASFLRNTGVTASTARAGNVIGGGDVSANRIIPDCIRSTLNGEAIFVRNPASVRPYQHVLEPLSAYLLIAERQYNEAALAGNYNVGPDENSCVTTAELAELFCKAWGAPARWETNTKNADVSHEAGLLRLDCSKIRSILGWRPVWNIETAVEMSVQWEKARISGTDMLNEMYRQIRAYSL